MARSLVMGLLLTAGSAAPAESVSAQPVEFNRDIRPVLSKACFTCHGPDEEARKARLRLDVREHAIRTNRSGTAAIVPGDPDSSELVRRIRSTDAGERMPPPDSGLDLDPRQIELLTLWVEQGAEYEHHWAYRKPERPEVPAVVSAPGVEVRNPIDAFVLARLQREGITPNPPAPRETLIRRVSLDLTGLPPTVEEVREFVNDERPDAYERLVERLLASPAYGERWARPWLDMARYADTNGYEADARRSPWPWRDWLIRALNADMPFDQFTIEQLAGDLLPNPTRDQLIATGFHRNTMTNTEGGTDDEEFRVAAVVDRVNTTFEVWMGTTFGCAQCHTHKYDPFTQKEYYEVFAIFNQTRDRGRTLDPVLELPTPEQAAEKARVQEQIDRLQAKLDTQTPELDAALDGWISRIEANQAARPEAWQPLEPIRHSATDGVVLEPLEDGSLLSTGDLPDNANYHIDFAPAPGVLSAIRLEALLDDRLPHGGPGRHDESDFTLTTFAATVHEPDGTPHPIRFNLAYADFEMPGYGVAAAIDENANSGWAVAAFEEKNRVARHAVFVAETPVILPEGGELRVVLHQQSSRARHLLGRVRLSASSLPREEHAGWAAVPPRLREVLARPASERTEKDREALAAHYRSIAPELHSIREELQALRRKLPRDIATTLVMAAVEKPRETHVMNRGNFLDPGEKVEPGVPGVLHPFPEGEPVDRLSFARWLVSPENPLVARVTVNRIWAAYFGIGIVETSEDFGSQGELPSHPDLLDWLACEFMEPSAAAPGETSPRAWSMKHIHRLIVHSATYRQSSEVDPELLERDPYNRLLARGPRFRMEAEMLRDNALAVGGLLNRRIGGPSVMPYQPEGVWANPYSSDRWQESRKGDQFRRGLYTFWRRTAAYPSFLAFDAPSREVCTERRSRSNTPVQALVTLNDPAFVVAAGGLARAVMEHGGEPEVRMRYAFQRTLARAPSSEEFARLMELYRAGLEHYRRQPEAAEAFVKVGLPAPAEGTDCAELAAWQLVANVLLNLDEAQTKG